MACKLTKTKGIKPCKGLSSVLQAPGSQGTRYQGVFFQAVINMKTGKFSRHFPVLKSGEHGKRGIIMNHCPFCGEEIFKSEAA